jgi:hypothetical protein
MLPGPRRALAVPQAQALFLVQQVVSVAVLLPKGWQAPFLVVVGVEHRPLSPRVPAPLAGSSSATSSTPS